MFYEPLAIVRSITDCILMWRLTHWSSKHSLIVAKLKVKSLFPGNWTWCDVIAHTRDSRYQLIDLCINVDRISLEILRARTQTYEKPAVLSDCCWGAEATALAAVWWTTGLRLRRRCHRFTNACVIALLFKRFQLKQEQKIGCMASQSRRIGKGILVVKRHPPLSEDRSLPLESSTVAARGSSQL